MWKKIETYSVDAYGLGRTVPVAWKNDGGAVVRMASGFCKDGAWEWSDPCAAEDVTPPDYWFDLPSLRDSKAWKTP